VFDVCSFVDLLAYPFVVCVAVLGVSVEAGGLLLARTATHTTKG
jgi:hypothetical protein